MSKSGPMHVAVLGVPGYSLMSMAALVEPMRAANLISGQELFRLEFVTTCQASVGFQAMEHSTLEGVSDVDLFCMVAGGDPFALEDPALMASLGALGRTSTRICGVSGGPVIMARAGLLGGYRTTVHWEHRTRFSEQFKAPIVVSGLYVIDRNRLTCAGGLACMDMVHALISESHGSDFARSVSDWFLHTDVRLPTGRQRSKIFMRYNATDQKVQQSLSFIHDHLSATITLADIARNIGLSDRQITRRFLNDIGVPPVQMAKQMRLDVARELVETSAQSFTEIAHALSFPCSSHFSAMYRRRFGETPTQTRINARKLGSNTLFD